MGIDTGLDSRAPPSGTQTSIDHFKPTPRIRRHSNNNQFSPMEREAGIEPASLAWKAKVLPLNYSRLATPPRSRLIGNYRVRPTSVRLVEEAGFEPA